jgi:predicted nucleotidyltransferase
MSLAFARLAAGHLGATRALQRSRGQAATPGKRTAKANDLLSTALASGALARLVGYFTVRPDDTPHIRALMRRTGLSARSVQLELERLERLGLVERQVATDGRVHIRATGLDTRWTPFRHLVQAYADPADLLHFALADVQGISAAFVFGSVARGTADDQSDVDLLVLTKPLLDSDAGTVERTVIRRAVEASLAIGREVNPVVLTLSQLAEKLANGRVFHGNIMAGPKRWVLGSPKGLRSVRRMARTKTRGTS